MKQAALILILLAAGSAPADVALSVVPPPQQRCMLRQPCGLRLEARGGQRPLRWRRIEGALPRGMGVEPDLGAIYGTPEIAGEFHATIEVTDSSTPPQRARREITIVVQSLLSVEWITLPALRDKSTLSGALRVSNQSGDEVVLTVVVVAVNQIGKAFTLGYQHFSLPTGQASPDIPFGMTMPSGTYKVRADAVGEVYTKNRIFRTGAETGTFVTP